MSSNLAQNQAHQYWIVPLTTLDVYSLNRLFWQECEEWLRVLQWDYSEPSQMIKEVIAAGQLPGFALLADNEVIGYSCYICEEHKILIGDLYVAEEHREAEAEAALAKALVEDILRQPRVKRIESQNISFGSQVMREVFRAYSFSEYERYFMICSLPGREEPLRGPFALRVNGRELVIRRWRADDFETAADIIHLSYVNQVDSQMNDQYMTRSGCKEFLTSLISFTGCGSFLPEHSWVVEDKNNQELYAVIITTVVSDRTAHFPQISVRPDWQGKGLGKELLRIAMNDLCRRGFKAVSLAVSAENTNAVRLYNRCGFRIAHQFPAFVRVL